MALEGCDQGFGGIVPDLDRSVVGSCEEVRLVGLRVVVNEVDSLRLMRLEGVVGRRAAERPDLDSPVETG